MSRGDLPVHQSRKIVIIDELLEVADLLEPGEYLVNLLVFQMKSKVLESSAHGVASAMLGQGQFRFAPTDVAGVDDLVGFPLLDDAVLVNAGAVREGVLAHDGLVSLDGEPGHPGHEPGSFDDLAGADVRIRPVETVPPGFQGEDDLLECGVAGTFADAVDGAFDLAGAVADCRQ